MPPSKRVLVSEGSSLSARQTITALGLAGHIVGVCDPDPRCIARFSRFVVQYYRCPALGKDPWGYLKFVLDLLEDGAWEILLPTHEQAFLFARERRRFPPGIGLALAAFPSFLHVQGKAALARTLTYLSIPQPPSHLIRSREELDSERRFPLYLKADYGTAAQSVWRIRNVAGLRQISSQLASQGLLDGTREFVVQEAAEGPLERVQAVFDHGHMVALHGYRQMAPGLRGGDIVKLGVSRAIVRQYMERLGENLEWHGALSLDYIYQEERQVPLFIDANPRLVEPMNAVFSGINLADVLVRISSGDPVSEDQSEPRPVRTHMLLMALLANAATTGRRMDVIREVLRAAAGRGQFRGGQEELLPLTIDFKGITALAFVLARLLLSPRSATALAAGSIASYSLTPEAAREIATGAPE